ncbi:hypothetical protein V8017_09145 [Stenotrophomonas rhizophila]
MFTAIAGSGGAQLRFSTVSDAQLQQDPAAFVRALRCIDVPPDCLFTVRFGSGTGTSSCRVIPGTRRCSRCPAMPTSAVAH